MAPETKREFKVSHCRHGDHEYSLTLSVEDIHADLSVFSYDHRPGHNVQVNLFNLNPEDITTLGVLLIAKGAELTAREAPRAVATPPAQEPA